MFHLRFVDRVKFFMERQFVKGSLFQLLIVAAVIGLISLTGGLLVHPVNEPSVTLSEAVWWAFLRLTDPGYIGDDEGTWRRIVSTFLTISGYVVFLGALVAIMTQRLIATMRELERGLTPVTLKNHVVILGWTNRTVPLVRELIGAEKSVRQFLLQRNANLQLVILAEEVSAARARELQDQPGIGGRMQNIVLRSGSALQPDALHRAACLTAAAVIIPSSAHGANSLVTPDVETIKALLSLDAQARQEGRQPPYVVAEVQDKRKLPLLQRAYSGRLEVLAGDTTISSLMAQNVLHPGLSEVYNELLTAHEGSDFYLRSIPAFAGQTLATVTTNFPHAIVCGLLRHSNGQWHAMLNPPSDLIVEEQDNIVLIASRFAHTEPASGGSARILEKMVRAAKPTLPVTTNLSGKHLLILGWSHRIPALIQELGTYAGSGLTVDVVSIVPIQERMQEISRYCVPNPRVRCQHIETDFMREGELREIAVATYDTIILVSSDRLGSGEEADARAIVGYMILNEMLQSAERYPQILLELADPDNEPLVQRNNSETIISPLILSHLLGQIALRPALRIVFDDLFSVGGGEIVFRDPSEYNLTQALAYWKLEAGVASFGETALGIYHATATKNGKHLLLNPAREMAINLQPGDQIVALTRA